MKQQKKSCAVISYFSNIGVVIAIRRQRAGRFSSTDGSSQYVRTEVLNIFTGKWSSLCI